MKHTLFGKAILLFLGLTLSTVAFADRWDKTITATPETAEIYVDGNLVGYGNYVLTFKRNEEFHVVKVKQVGYVDKEIKVYKKDKVNVKAIKLLEAESFNATIESPYANKNFTIIVRDNLDAKTAWKIITQTLLNYYTEMQVTDYTSGYMVTPYLVERYANEEIKVRNRVQVKELTNDGTLTYQVKIISEKANIYSNNENAYAAWNRINKTIEPLINELQTRLGSKNI